MLRAAEEHYLQQQRYLTVGLAAARRAWRLGNPALLLPALTVLQRAAAQDGVASVEQMLAEQSIDVTPMGAVIAGSLAGVASDGRPLGSLLSQATTSSALELMTVTQISDASRIASGMAIAARPKVGWTRMVNPPCCPRCAVLAGKFFRWNDGFQRHPGCDCTHIPTQEDVAGDVRTDPKTLFEQGHVNGVTKAEQKAINEGADINRVINARRSLYMDEAGHKLTREATTKRGGAPQIRPTPEQIYRTAGDDQAAAVRSLKKFGYIL